MGSGEWSSVSYTSAHTARIASSPSASSFSYTDDVMAATPVANRKAHATLDPKGVAFRESRDSDEHPTSTPIIVMFDETGSMSQVPRRLQVKLPELYGLLLRKGYVEHPQILFGGFGDATCDRVPLQVGQFESDNRADDDLANIFLEGNGGGQRPPTESYELVMYWAARHTVTDAWEKRGRRGHMFIIGDEMAYPEVKPYEVNQFIGDDISEPIPVKTMLHELQEKWDVWYIHPEGASYVGEPQQMAFWRDLLGQQYVQLDDLDAVCETIGVSIGLAEGAIDDLDEGLTHLDEIGSTAGASVGKALATVGAKGTAVSESDGPEDLSGDSGAERL